MRTKEELKKEYMKQYRQTPQYKAYLQSPHRREYVKEYIRSPQHIFVVLIPQQTHKAGYGLKRTEHRQKVNQYINKLGFDIDDFIMESGKN